jgi:peptidoglycan hydrolase-like protein with peptidoglycan-binding domain
MPLRACIALGFSLLVLCQALPAAAAGDPDVAALQVALRARGLYDGAVDGLAGPRTGAAVRSFQRRAGIAVDGVAGRQTRSALGRRWRRSLGSRVLQQGKAGWDVAALQFLLAWHGFPSGPFDGGFGPRTAGAVTRFQRWVQLSPDGVAGPATIAALRSAPRGSPIRLAWPIRGPLGDRFGPRGDRFHTGLDFPAPYGAAVAAAGSGRVVKAGWDGGGWGYLVVVRHGYGVRTMYAHLSTLAVRRGQHVATGALVGRVGSSGASTGPHLHFEVRLRGAAIDPLTALG